MGYRKLIKEPTLERFVQEIMHEAKASPSCFVSSGTKPRIEEIDGLTFFTVILEYGVYHGI